MPLPVLELTGLLALLEAWLLDGERPAMPDPEAGEEGLADGVLWDRMLRGDDVLLGMPFEAAVARDPRRVEALLDQRTVVDLYRGLDALRNGPGSDFLRQVWLTRNRELRTEHGRVTAAGVAEARRQTWGSLSKVLEVAVKMRRPDTPADRFWRALLVREDDVRRGFREAVEIASRAAFVAPSEDDVRAWEEVSALLENTLAAIDDRIREVRLAMGADAPAPRPALPEPGLDPVEEPVEAPEPVEEGEEGYGGGFFDASSFDEAVYGGLEAWVEAQDRHGHRAPGLDVAAMRRAGGRWTG